MGNDMETTVSVETLAQAYVKAEKKRKRAKSIEKVLKYGIALGWMASMLYLMLVLTATLTA